MGWLQIDTETPLSEETMVCTITAGAEACFPDFPLSSIHISRRDNMMKLDVVS